MSARARASATNSLCERIHQCLDRIFTYYNIELWNMTTKVKPFFYCKERWDCALPPKKDDSFEKEYVVVPIRDSEQVLEKKYLNGYPNGAGKRPSIDNKV